MTTSQFTRDILSDSSLNKTAFRHSDLVAVKLLNPRTGAALPTDDLKGGVYVTIPVTTAKPNLIAYSLEVRFTHTHTNTH